MTSFKVGAKGIVVMTRADWTNTLIRTKHVKFGAGSRVFIVDNADSGKVADMAARFLAKAKDADAES